MGKLVFKDAVIEVNGQDLSTHANQVTIEDTAEEVEFTGFGRGYREFGQGLKDATITATFFQDFESSSVHQTLQPLYESGGTFDVKIKPSSSTAVAPGSSVATMTARLYSYGGIGGAVGDALTTEATFRHAGTAGVVWGTA